MRIGAIGERLRVERMRRIALALAFTAGCRLRARLMQLRDRFRERFDFRVGAIILVAASGTAFAAAMFIPDRDAPIEARPVSAAAPLPVEAPSPPVAPPRLALSEPPRIETWAPVRRPIVMYHLEGSDTEGLSLVAGVATRGPGARQDRFVWSARENRPSARLAIGTLIERFEAGLPPVRPFFPDLAMRAAEEGFTIERMSQPGEIATKFGGFEVADAHLVSETGRFACLVYRRSDMLGLVVAGWFCGTPERPADRLGLACFLDRLDLVGAGKDQALKRHFAAAERNRKRCGGQRMAGRKPNWYEHEAPLPPLKLTQRGR